MYYNQDNVIILYLYERLPKNLEIKIGGNRGKISSVKFSFNN